METGPTDTPTGGKWPREKTMKVELRVWRASSPGNVASQTLTLELENDRNDEAGFLDEIVAAVNELVEPVADPEL